VKSEELGQPLNDVLPVFGKNNKKSYFFWFFARFALPLHAQMWPWA
jgi:hypothetical protein